MGVWDNITGAADHAAGSTDEWVGRQTGGSGDSGGSDDSDDSGGSGGPLWQGPDPLNIGSQFGGEGDTGRRGDHATGEYGGDLNGPETFGDGSNEWIPGLIETVNNPVNRATHPYDTVAGGADALTLNFDEGVGGLSSLFDDEKGNTAGPGQSPAFGWLAGVERQEGQPANPGTTGSPLIDQGFRLALIVAGAWLLVSFGPALANIGSAVVGD